MEQALRANAELELLRIRSQAGLIKLKITQCEADLTKWRGEAEVNAKAAAEKEELLARLNALAELQAHYRQLKQSFDEHAQQLVRLREHIHELEQTLDNKAQEERNEFAALEAKHTELTQNYSNVLTALNTVRTTSNQQKDAWTEKKTKLEDELKSAQEQLIRKEEEAVAASEEIDKLKSENAALTEKNTKLVEIIKNESSASLEKEKTRAERYRNERNALTKEKTKMEAELKSVRDDLARVKKAAERSPSTASKEIAKLKNENAALSEKYNAEKQKCKELETAVQKVRLFARQFRDEKNALTEEKTKLKDELKSVRAQLALHNGYALSFAANTPSAMMAANTRLLEENAALKTKLSILLHFKAERDQMRGEIEQMQHAMDEQAEKVMRIDMVEKTLRTCQQRLEGYKTEIQKLLKFREENAQLKRQIEELEQHLAAAKAQQQQQQAVQPLPTGQSTLQFTFAEPQEVQQMPILELEPNPASQGPLDRQQQQEFIVETPDEVEEGEVVEDVGDEEEDEMDEEEEEVEDQLDSGEPPRKQRRMLSQEQQHGDEEANNMDIGEDDDVDADNDIDDDDVDEDDDFDEDEEEDVDEDDDDTQ